MTSAVAAKSRPHRGRSHRWITGRPTYCHKLLILKSQAVSGYATLLVCICVQKPCVIFLVVWLTLNTGSRTECSGLSVNYINYPVPTTTLCIVLDAGIRTPLWYKSICCAYQNSVYCFASNPRGESIHLFSPCNVFECKISLFDLLKMCFNNRNCHHGELEYYSQIGIN